MRVRVITSFLLLLPPAVAAQATACDSDAHRLPLPLVGVWQEFTVTPNGEVLQGELRSSLEAHGCAFVQEFESVTGAFTFRSLGHVDPESGRWLERFVLSDGRTAVYDWAADGDDILLSRLRGGDGLYRLRVTRIARDSYEVIEERSADDGLTWTRGERTITRRVGS